MGFVELRVAELEPNGADIAGWFELRPPHALEGTASRRFNRHRSKREDLSPNEDVEQGLEQEGEEEEATSADGGEPKVVLTAVPEESRSLEEGVAGSGGGRSAKSKLAALAFSPQIGVRALRAATDGLSGSPQSDEQGSQRNAGEIYLALRLETFARPVEPQPPLPSTGRLLFAALFNPAELLNICHSEEWYACCLPDPEFETVQETEDDTFSLQDVKDFYEDVAERRNRILTCFVWPLYSIFLYVVGWRDLLLSSAIVAYWWLLCMWPRFMLCLAPMWAVLWLCLLRDRDYSNKLLAHEQTAPLTQEGLEMMASLESSKRIITWLRRLVRDRGGWVDRMSNLTDFARLTHKDGHPTFSFDELVEDLCTREWISRRVQQEKRCQKGHVLCLLGTGAYRPDSGWCCHGMVSKGAHSCEVGLNEVGLHLGTRRYHCPLCKVDCCAVCAHGGKRVGTVMKVDTSKLPMGGSVIMRAIKDFVTENIDGLDSLKDLSDNVLKVMERLLNPGDAKLAFRVYSVSCVTTLALLVTSLLIDSTLGFIIRWAWLTCWIAVGSAVMLPQFMPFRRLSTAFRASQGLAKCRDLRAKGGCARWQFFSPDPAFASVPAATGAASSDR